MKKLLKISGTICGILAIISLALPVFRTVFSDGESMTLTLRGVDILSFSPWSYLVLVLPLILVGIAYSKVSDELKSLLVMLPLVFGLVSVFNAYSAMREWIYTEATGYVHVYGGLFAYIVLMLVSSILFYLCHNGKKERGEVETSGVAITTKPVDVLEGDFFLCNRPVKFSKFGKRLKYKEFDGCISFSTEDGYFAALGHGDDKEYIDNGCIEFSDEDDTIRGFATRTMPYGLYGSFYEDCEQMRWKLKILPFPKVTEGEARLLLPDGEGDFSEIPVTLNPVSITHIDCRLLEDLKTESPIDGAVIVQNGKIAAIVSEYNKENNKHICVSSEIPAADLLRMVYEQKVLEEIRSLEEREDSYD